MLLDLDFGLSLPAGDLMPSVASDPSTSSTGRRHNSISTNSRAFFNSHYPRPPRHKPLHAPSADPPSFTLPPSPPVFQPQGDSIKMSEDFSPSSVPRDGFPEFNEMSRSLNDYGNNSISSFSARGSAPGSAFTSSSSSAAIAMRGRSKMHGDLRRDSDDGLCSQMDGLDISAKSSSPTVLSVLTEFSLNKRHGNKAGATSIISALSAPSTLSRTECSSGQIVHMPAAGTNQSRTNSISDAMAAVPEHGIFAFEDETSEDAPMETGAHHHHHQHHHQQRVPTGMGLASRQGMNTWRGVM